MPDDADVALILALVDRQTKAREQLRTRLETLIRRLFGTFDGWYDDTSTRALAHRISTVVRTSAETQGTLSGQFQQHVLEVLQADVRRPVPVKLPPSLRNLTDETIPYERPFAEYRRLRAEGLTPQQARDAAAGRAVLIAGDDLQLAAREASRQRLVAADKVIGWRRVIHPELSLGGTCGLCVVASDRIYQKPNLMAIHTGCHCEPLPVTKAHDPGQSLNAGDLRRLYAAAGNSTSAEDLRKVRVKTRMHGELGPILTDGRHRFRTEEQASASRRTA